MIVASAPRHAGALPVAAIVVLIGVALWPWLRWAVDAPTAPPAATASAARALPALPPLEALRETAERPLFSADRRPAATPHAAGAPHGFRLEGVIAIGAQARAIIKRPDGTTARVVEGDAIGEWTVRRIEPGRVVLGAGERRLELRPGRAPRAGAPTR